MNRFPQHKIATNQVGKKVVSANCNKARDAFRGNTCLVLTVKLLKQDRKSVSQEAHLLLPLSPKGLILSLELGDYNKILIKT